MVRKLYLVKIGGSLIAGQSDEKEIRHNEIRRLLLEIKKAKTIGGFDIIIGHGSGAVGHVPSLKYGVHRGLRGNRSRMGSVLTERAVSRLNDVVVMAALKLGMPVFQFSPHSFGVTKRGKINSIFVQQLSLALRNGFIPLIYGDIFMDSAQGVSDLSTEEVLRAIASKLRPDKIVLCTDVDGVFDRNPKIYKNAKLISSINGKNINAAMKYTDKSLKIDVTGGMTTKLSLLYSAVKESGAAGYIVNGNKKGSLTKILLGKKVTNTRVTT